MESLMTANDSDKHISIVIFRSCKLESSILSSIECFLRGNLTIEEVWLEDTQGFADNFMEEVQKSNPFIRFKVNGKVQGQKSFLPRKIYLHSLKKVRKVSMEGLSVVDNRASTIACIYWSRSKDSDLVYELVSSNDCSYLIAFLIPFFENYSI